MRVSKKGDRQKPAYPVFSISFTEGLADRNRLPLDHVIRVLTEIKGMIEAAGKRIQRQRGVDEPTGDFGLELIGGFRKGSVKAALAITRDENVGVLAARQVLDTVTRLSAVPRPKAKAAHVPISQSEYDPRLVARLGNISKVQEIDKTRVAMRLVPTTGGRALTAVFDRRTTQVLSQLRAPHFGVEELTIYGKLRQLRDKHDEGDEAKRSFFGELLGDDGIVWRIEFKGSDTDKVTALFRKQVCITGNATYYRAMNPKIVVNEIQVDEERDYETAFDEMYGASPELVGVGLKKLIHELETD